jgi:hypothetical protein
MKDIKKLERSDGADAFIAEPGTQNGPAPDDLAEYLGESFVSSATGAEDADEGLQADVNIEEFGGPFVETDAIDAGATFGSDPHSDNPAGVAKPARDRSLGIVAAPPDSKPRRVHR